MSQAASSDPAMDITAGFPPIMGNNVRVLVLGTLPSQQSLLRNQYYGHPRNAFWPIMGELFGAGPERSYAARCEILKRQRVAVWDVLKSGSRPGSMDVAIDADTAAPNDFGQLHADHPALRLVCFNGQAAGRLFLKLVPADIQECFASVKFVTMPSTSPAYAAMSFEEKAKCWAAISH